MLGWSENEIKGMNIEKLMPMPIKQKHSHFMNKFSLSGETFIINKKATMFIKRNNGYVIPVELFIRFYYSVENEYTFLAIIKPFSEMAPFKNGNYYPLN